MGLSWHYNFDQEVYLALFADISRRGASRGLTPRDLCLLNPALPDGGWSVASKLERYRWYRGHRAAVKSLGVGLPIRSPGRVAEGVIAELGGSDLIAKPDRASLGRGVRRLRGMEELLSFLVTETGVWLLQPYVDLPFELAATYLRHPGERRGRIVDLTERRLPSVTGDGRSTISELIDARVEWEGIRAGVKESCPALLDVVLSEGEVRQLAVSARMSSGVAFKRHPDLITPELEAELHSLADCFTVVDVHGDLVDGYHWGKIDLKAPSLGALREGRVSGIQILEVNGSMSEPNGLFDLSMPLDEARSWVLNLTDELFTVCEENLLRLPRPEASAGEAVSNGIFAVIAPSLVRASADASQVYGGIAAE